MPQLLIGTKFSVSAARLPAAMQRKLAESLSVLAQNPYDSRLHTKALSGNLDGIFSFRLSRDWRVLFAFQTFHCIQLLRVKHRKDIYR